MKWDILNALPERLRSDVRSRMVRCTFAKDEYIVLAGQPADGIHFIDHGRVAVKGSTPAGDETTLAILGPGDIFGELALLRPDHRRTATAMALEPKTQSLVLTNDVWNELRRQPEVDRLVSSMTTSYIQRLGDQLAESLFVPAETRVVRHLIALCDKYETNPDGSRTIRLTKEELADLAGTSRQLASTVLNRLESLTDDELAHGGVAPLTLGRGQVVVHDVADLIRRERAMKQSKSDLG